MIKDSVQVCVLVEAFTAEEIAAVHDVNVLSTQRINLAALPHLRS